MEMPHRRPREVTSNDGADLAHRHSLCTRKTRSAPRKRLGRKKGPVHEASAALERADGFAAVGSMGLEEFYDPTAVLPDAMKLLDGRVAISASSAAARAWARSRVTSPSRWHGAGRSPSAAVATPSREKTVRLSQPPIAADVVRARSQSSKRSPPCAVHGRPFFAGWLDFFASLASVRPRAKQSPRPESRADGP